MSDELRITLDDLLSVAFLRRNGEIELVKPSEMKPVGPMKAEDHFGCRKVSWIVGTEATRRTNPKAYERKPT